MVAAGFGVGSATVVPSIAIVARLFRGNIGFAVGAIVAAGASGAAVGPPILGYGIEAIGWRAAICRKPLSAAIWYRITCS